MENNSIYGRSFISMTLSESMLKLINTGPYALDIRKVTLSELREVKELYSFIKNSAVISTLTKAGVELSPSPESTPEFTLGETDTLYVIRFESLGKKEDGSAASIRDFKDESELPRLATMDITKYTVKEKVKLAEEVVLDNPECFTKKFLEDSRFRLFTTNLVKEAVYEKKII